MNSIPFISVSIFLLLTPILSSAQFRPKSKPINLYIINPRQGSSTRLLAAQTQSYNQIPVLSGAAAMPFGQSNSYWLTRMTTQSINQGKMGTNYFWDQQGNLRESRFFVEVGGKKRPGLKLVFPRRWLEISWPSIHRPGNALHSCPASHTLFEPPH